MKKDIKDLSKAWKNRVDQCEKEAKMIDVILKALKKSPPTKWEVMCDLATAQGHLKNALETLTKLT